MEEDKLKLYIINKMYVNYLRKFDTKIQNIEYNSKLKPYIGILITINLIIMSQYLLRKKALQYERRHWFYKNKKWGEFDGSSKSNKC